MAEPKISFSTLIFKKAQPNDFGVNDVDKYDVNLYLDNCNLADARLFMNMEIDGMNHGTIEMDELRRVDELSLQTGTYTFYLFCGENLHDIRGQRSEIFAKVESHCKNPQNGCKMVTKVLVVNPPPPIKGGRRSKHRRSSGRSGGRRRSSGRRRSGGRRHCKSHRR